MLLSYMFFFKMINIRGVFVLIAKCTFVFTIFVNISSAQENFNVNSLKFYEKRIFHRPKTLSRGKMLDIAVLYNEQRFKNTLSNILVPRDVGTAGHEKVKNYIVDFLRRLNWDIELDEFTQYIPSRSKDMTFTTIVSRLNPNASRYLVLACHYDSKYMKNQKFYAATDSAVPCAMLLDMAESLNEHLNRFRSTDLSLMFIFFDGEEAFARWGPTDSIYGAKHLAKKWEVTPYHIDNANQMQRMDVLMLLDLLGARDPKFYYYSEDTKHLHGHLVNIQNRLSRLEQLQDYSDVQKYFVLEKSNSYVEDDHIPFVFSSTPVPVLHIIPNPFPSVWHTLDDNYKELHFPTINNLNKIFSVFTLSYLSGEFNEAAFGKFFARSSKK